MFICDYLFAGVTLGKLAAGLKVEFTGPISRLRFALLHTLCKCVVMPMYVIGFIIFLCCGGRMPYDWWLKFRIIEKN